MFYKSLVCPVRIWGTSANILVSGIRMLAVGPPGMRVQATRESGLVSFVLQMISLTGIWGAQWLGQCLECFGMFFE